MGYWQVRPHPRGGWQVLTPGHTQATASRDRDEAIAKATRMVADEGGGYLVVVDEHGTPSDTRQIFASARPYLSSLGH